MPTCSVDFCLISTVVFFFHMLIYLFLPGANAYVCVNVCVCMFYLFHYLLQIAFLTRLWVCALKRKPFFWENIFLKMFYIMKQALVRGRVIILLGDVPHAHIMLFFITFYSNVLLYSAVLLSLCRSEMCRPFSFPHTSLRSYHEKKKKKK